MPVHAPLVLAVAASLAASSSIAHAADVLAADAGPGRTLDAVQVTAAGDATAQAREALKTMASLTSPWLVAPSPK